VLWRIVQKAEEFILMFPERAEDGERAMR